MALLGGTPAHAQTLFAVKQRITNFTKAHIPPTEALSEPTGAITDGTIAQKLRTFFVNRAKIVGLIFLYMIIIS